MFGSLLGEIRATNMYNAVQNFANSYIAIGTTTPSMLLYDLNTRGPVGAGVLSLASNCVALAFVGSEQCVAWCSSGTPYLVNFSGSGTVNSITSQSISPQTTYNARHQIMASQISASQCVGISNTSGNFLCVDYSSGTAVSSKIVVGSGKTFTCIIPKGGSTTSYLAGTTDGTIYDFTFTGTVNNSFTLPTTPVLRNSATMPIGSLAMDSAGANLVVATSQGFNFHYSYSSSPTLAETLMVREVSGYGHILSNIVNGNFFHLSGSSSNLSVESVPLLLIGPPSLEIDQYYSMYGVAQNFACGISNNTSIPGYSGAGWTLIPGTTGSDPSSLIRVFGMDGLATATTTTRAQQTLGTDSSFRSIRMLNVKPGLSRVESDLTESAGVQSITLGQEGADYYELALVGSQGVNEYADFRKVQA